MADGEGKQAIFQIPEELVLAEILIRLPVKSLLRFRLVSKGWNSVISSPQFAKSHLSCATNNPFAPPPYNLLVSSTRDLYSLELGPGGDTCGTNDLIKVDKLVPESHLHFFVGSCHGLVCFRSCTSGYSLEDFYVYNPSTRWRRQVFSPSEVRGATIRLGFGFGYVSSSDDYKIVVLQFPRDGSKVLMFVYSLNSCKWNKHEVVRNAKSPLVLEMGQLVNETLHWIVFQGWSYEKQCVLGFDLADETIKELPLPKSRLIGLFVSSGCLCIREMINKSVEVWMLKQYGVWDSWTKLFKLEDLPGWEALSGDFLGFIDIGGTCSVLTRNEDNRVVFTDLNGEQLKYVGGFDHIEVLSYVESLSSPFAAKRLEEGSTTRKGVYGSSSISEVSGSSSLSQVRGSFSVSPAAAYGCCAQSFVTAICIGLLSVLVALLALKFGPNKLLG
ncbi:hypothetical protein Dimus_028338 [Dionaea muscipula]